MIRLTRLNNTEIWLNPDLIERLEPGAETVVALTHGSSFIVKESPEEIVDRIVFYRQRILKQPGLSLETHSAVEA